MSYRRARSATLVCLAVAAATPATVLALPAFPAGVELQVNTRTTNAQWNAAVGMDAAGRFVVAWQSDVQDGAQGGVFARRFDAAGIGQAAEFQVNSYTTNAQKYPAVAVDSAGAFVVVWQSVGQDGNGAGVFGRRFSAAGVPQAAEFQVNSYTTGYQAAPAVGMDGDGDFVVAWQSQNQDLWSYGVFARRFSSAGVAQAVEFQVNSYTTNIQSNPAVAMDATGDFVVAWQSYGQDGALYGVFGRRFNSAGVAQATEFQANASTEGSQLTPAGDIGGAGDFVVSWQGPDSSSNGVFARRFSSAGVAQTGDLQVNSFTVNNQYGPTVGIAGNGDFVVAWSSYTQDGSSSGVSARSFSSTGVAQAQELQVNTHTASGQSGGALGMDDGGDFVVAWQSYAQDGESFGVFAQRYETPAVLDIDADGTTAALTDGLLVLRYLFGFRGSTLVSGAVDQGCQRCDAPAIETYLATLI